MRVTDRLQKALKAASRFGITEISISKGDRFGRKCFSVVKVRNLLRAQVGTQFSCAKYGQMETARSQIEQTGRCQYKNVWSYLDRIEKQEELF